MKKSIINISIFILGISLSACMGKSNKAKDDNHTSKDLIQDGYKLVWEEDFNSNDIDSSIWNIELVKKPHNREMQEYKAENISIGQEPLSGKSCLVITGRKENRGKGAFTSGRLNTMNKFSFRYGRIDACIKLPKTANGLWPAFWMMGDDRDEIGWPACGEIDILEMGHKNGIVNSTQETYLGAACHWGPNSKLHKSAGKKENMPYSLQDEKFHVYSAIWDKDSIAFYVDLDENPEKKPWYVFNYAADTNNAAEYFRKEFHILLNLAIGGTYTGIVGSDKVEKITGLNKLNDYEAKMYVDYIRVYQRGNSDEQLTLPK